DLAESRTTILIFGPITVVLDTECADLAPTLLNVGDRIVVLIINYIARIVADPDAGIVHVLNNSHAVYTGGGVAAVLLYDDCHVVLSGNRSEFHLIANPNIAPARLYRTKGEYEWHALGRT